MAEAHSSAIDVHLGVPIPMRDGARLSAIHYSPGKRARPGGVICALTPYTAQSLHDRGIYFAGRGLSFLAIDVRGRGNSEGVFQPFINEGADAADAVDWICQQPFCNGKVAMWGGSYSGYVQWAAAAATNRLSTIAPAAAPFCGADFPGRRNVPMPYLVQWLVLVWGRASQGQMFADPQGYWTQKLQQFFEAGAPFATLAEHFGLSSATFNEWIEHPHQDEYWDRYSPTREEYANISLPVLTITGIYDSDQPGALAHYRAHVRACPPASRHQHHLIIGPWDHPGTRTPQTRFGGITVSDASRLDLDALHVEWYKWAFGEGEKPRFLSQRITYYMMGADEWRYADSLESFSADQQVLYFNDATSESDPLSSGILAPYLNAGATPGQYVYDPSDVGLAALERTIDPYDLTDTRLLDAAAGVHLSYQTPPLDADTEIAGFFRAQLWLSIDQPDTDFAVTLYEIAPDGASLRLTSDLIRARYREDARRPQIVQSNEPLLYTFDQFTFLARRVAKGCRLRCVIGPINSIHAQKNYNSGREVARESMRDARVVRVRLHHDEQYKSTITIPLARHALHAGSLGLARSRLADEESQ